jgi:Dyp-type peroxidase family
MNQKISPQNYNPDFLDDIQGNILQPHERNHARHLLISFGRKKKAEDSIHTWIQQLSQKISSCWQELSRSEDSLFCSLLLTQSGYRYLNLSMPADKAFQSGMVSRGSTLCDPNPSSWEPNYTQATIDALLIVAGNNPVDVAQEIVLIKENLLAAGGDVLVEEQGHRLVRSELDIEHFGFVDGISQPKHRSVSISKSTSPTLMTNPDVLLAPDGNGGYGSYFVFRKLEQNVKLWEENVQALAEQTKTSPFLTGAWAMGRFKDGTPVVEHEQMQFCSVPNNSFNYAKDSSGDICPFHAHMRKMNMRNNDPYPRIARRAMTFGLRPDLHPQGKMFSLPEKGVGLLFMCFQKNIEEGFEYLQCVANDPDAPLSGAGQDPLISQGNGQKVTNQWPTKYNDTTRIQYSFDRTVTLKGGEYFIAPSISCLKQVVK